METTDKNSMHQIILSFYEKKKIIKVTDPASHGRGWALSKHFLFGVLDYILR